jgi:hypothetical protein
LDLNEVKFVSPCKERGKKIFGKILFCLCILARLILLRSGAAGALLRSGAAGADLLLSRCAGLFYKRIGGRFFEKKATKSFEKKEKKRKSEKN